MFWKRGQYFTLFITKKVESFWILFILFLILPNNFLILIMAIYLRRIPPVKLLISKFYLVSFRCLDDISDEVLSIFAPSAKELIEKRDGNAEEALAAALAYISGVTEIVQRSLLTSQPVCLYFAFFHYKKIPLFSPLSPFYNT